MSDSKNKRTGFTLIELIATLILVGFVGALILPFFYSGILNSSTPMERVANNRQLQTFVENAMEYFFESSNSYFGFQFIDNVQPLQDDYFSNGTKGPMLEFAEWLDTDWGDLEGSDNINSLSADYITVDPVESPDAGQQYTPYASDKKVVRVVVEHNSGLQLVFFLGQDNVKNKQLSP